MCKQTENGDEGRKTDSRRRNAYPSDNFMPPYKLKFNSIIGGGMGRS